MPSDSQTRIHDVKNPPTKTITFRLPKNLIEDLQPDAEQKHLALNALVKQILEKYTTWDRYSDSIGMLEVPKQVLRTLGANHRNA